MGIESGDRIRLDYVGRFEDDTVFATTKPDVAAAHGLRVTEDEPSRTPLTFTVGSGDVIDGIDRAVRGMESGESATVTVSPEDGYGEYDPERVREYDPETFRGMTGQQPAVGVHVEAQNGLHGDVTVVGDTVQVDFNHELAGQPLVFDLHVLGVE